jgi:DNA-binding response OmpR family regulator
MGLEMGADDYIVKPFSLRELIARVRAALRRAYGDLAIAPETGRIVFDDVSIDLEQMQAYRAGQPVTLTPIEFRLLRLLATTPEKVFSRSELIEAIWGYESDAGSGRMIDVHIRHLREKLEEDPANPRWLVTVRGFGYKFQP